MIKIFFFGTLLCFSNYIAAQCYPDRHSTAQSDGWISCAITQNPNPSRAFSHWIMYDFGAVENIDGMKVWNSNIPDFADLGIESFALDYSIDGENWTHAGDFVIPDHTPGAFYQGDEIEGIPAISARHVIITALSTKGGTCAGLAEVRFYRGNTSTSTDDINQFEFEVYPNPTMDFLNISINDEAFNMAYYEIVNLSGQILDRVFTDQRFIRLNVKGFAEGQYVIKLQGDRDQIITEQFQVFKQ